MEEFKPNTKYIVVFRSVHDVIKSERIIQVKKINYQIVTVPTRISSECGMCIELEGQNILEVINDLKQKEIFHRVYQK